MKRTITKQRPLSEGETYLVVIEWDACEEAEPEDWDESASGAYEFADAVTYDELLATLYGAMEEARNLLDSNGSGWVSVLIGIGESMDELDIENAIGWITSQNDTAPKL